MCTKLFWRLLPLMNLREAELGKVNAEGRRVGWKGRLTIKECLGPGFKDKNDDKEHRRKESSMVQRGNYWKF